MNSESCDEQDSKSTESDESIDSITDKPSNALLNSINDANEVLNSINDANEVLNSEINVHNETELVLNSNSNVDNETELNELVKQLSNNLNFDDESETDEICWQTDEWKNKEKHIFILSSAGKPIYSRYGNEDDLVTLFGVMQAIVSVVLDSDDEIQSIHTSNTNFTFLRKGFILLVSVSQIQSDSKEIAILQLNYVYNQILSILTYSQLSRIFERHNNFDLRRLLTGSERLINSFLDFTENDPGFFLGGIACLPLNSSARDNIVQAITSSCQKIKNLLFAILLAKNQLIVLIRMKKYNLSPPDLHLIFNLISSSQSFRTAEGWTPICLPAFDSSGYMQAHVSYLTEDCQACLLLLTIDRELFFALSEAKQKIVELLKTMSAKQRQLHVLLQNHARLLPAVVRRGSYTVQLFFKSQNRELDVKLESPTLSTPSIRNKLQKVSALEQINEALEKSNISPSEFSIPKLRHFIYKNKNINQYVYPVHEVPYHTADKQKALLRLYSQLHKQMNTSSRPLKLLFQQLKTEAVLGWDTKGFQLYLIFEPFITKQDAINAVNKLLKCMKKDEDKLFINNSPTF